jgi:hypothetical protein
MFSFKNLTHAKSLSCMKYLYFTLLSFVCNSYHTSPTVYVIGLTQSVWEDENYNFHLNI